MHDLHLSLPMPEQMLERWLLSVIIPLLSEFLFTSRNVWILYSLVIDNFQQLPLLEEHP